MPALHRVLSLSLAGFVFVPAAHAVCPSSLPTPLRLACLDNEVTLLKQQMTDLLSCISVSGTDVVIEGCNLHIQNGTGSTETTNELGNLFIGYNNSGADQSGSHTLVIGDSHSFSSYAGLLAGFSNTLSAPYSTVSGGVGNYATGNYSSVSGGSNNSSQGHATSILGGDDNGAVGDNSTIAGGFQNAVTGGTSSILGGYYSSITSQYSVICGGYYPSATGSYYEVVGC